MKTWLNEGARQWQKLPPRDQRALQGLALLLGALALVWVVVIPLRQKLQSAERVLHEQQSLATRLANDAGPSAIRPAPSAHLLSEQAKSAGLVIDQFTLEDDQLRLSASGPGQAVAAWLGQLQSGGVDVLELTVVREEANLQVQLQIQLNPEA